MISFKLTIKIIIIITQRVINDFIAINWIPKNYFIFVMICIIMIHLFQFIIIKKY